MLKEPPPSKKTFTYCVFISSGIAQVFNRTGYHGIFNVTKPYWSRLWISFLQNMKTKLSLTMNPLLKNLES